MTHNLENNNTKNTKHCAIYTCTYKDMQTEHPSLEDQRLRCERYAQEHGLEIIPTRYEDQDAPKSHLERPGLQKLLSDIVEGDIDYVVVDKLDCLVRSVRSFLGMMIFFIEHDVSLRSAIGEMEAGGPATNTTNVDAFFKQCFPEEEDESAPIRCAIYTCTYKHTQTEHPSLEDQRLRCEQYAHKYGYEIIPTCYEDQDAPKSYLKRPGLQKLLSDIREGKIDCVAVDQPWHLSHSLQELTQITEIFIEHNVALVSVSDVGTKTTAGHSFIGLLRLLVQLEKKDAQIEKSK